MRQLLHRTQVDLINTISHRRSQTQKYILIIYITFKNRQSWAVVLETQWWIRRSEMAGGMGGTLRAVELGGSHTDVFILSWTLTMYALFSMYFMLK
jgi:hypothetical protein